MYAKPISLHSNSPLKRVSFSVVDSAFFPSATQEASPTQTKHKAQNQESWMGIAWSSACCVSQSPHTKYEQYWI